MNPLESSISARPAGLPSGPREDYIPPHPYRRDEIPSRGAAPCRGAALPGAAPCRGAAPRFDGGRLSDRIEKAVESGIRDVQEVVRAVRAGDAVVRSMLTRMEKSGKLRLHRDERGLAMTIVEITKSAKSVKRETVPAVSPPLSASPAVMERESAVVPTDISEAVISKMPAVIPDTTININLQQGSQVGRVRMAVGLLHAHTLTEIANATGLTRDQTSKAISFLVARFQLRDLPIRDGERCVEMVDKNTTDQSLRPPKTKAKPHSGIGLESTTKGSIMDMEKVCSDLQEELERSMKAIQVEMERLARIKKRLPDVLNAWRASQAAIVTLEKVRHVVSEV